MQRETLIALVGALTGGLVLGSAMRSKLMVDPDTRRYVKIIDLQKKTLAISATLNTYLDEESARRKALLPPSTTVIHTIAPRGQGYGIYDVLDSDEKAQKLRAKLTKAADEVLCFGLENFSRENSLEVQYQISDMFDGWLKIDTMSVEGLKNILEAVVTTAILRNIIHSKARLDTMRMRYLDQWAMVAKPMIFGETRPREDRLKLYPAFAELHGKWWDGKVA